MANVPQRIFKKGLAAFAAATVALTLFILKDLRVQEPAGTASGDKVNCSSMGDAANHPLPIADAHFHILPWMTPAELCRLMRENGIKWIGGGGQMQPDGFINRYRKVFGERWRVFGGQREHLAEIPQQHGVNALEDAEHPAMRQLVATLESDLKSGRYKGIGELLVNTRTSATRPDWRRKIRADSPGVKALLNLAAKYGLPVSIHAQWDNDTAEQMNRLAESNRNGVIFLAHCGTDASADQIRDFLSKNLNVYCDMSSRYDRSKAAGRTVYSAGWLEPSWKKLIEAMADRFTAGIDDVFSEAEYLHTVKAVREGLLANLSPEAAKKVAYENADRLFRISK